MDHSADRHPKQCDECTEPAAWVHRTQRAGSHYLCVAHAQLRPDVILLDYAVPGMDGAEVSQRLRADRSTAAIPLILMSAHPPAARPQMPIDAELRKPFDLEALSAAVARWTDTIAPRC